MLKRESPLQCSDENVQSHFFASQEKEKENTRSGTSVFSSHLVFSVLSQLTGAERQYMSLGYIAPKRFLMKDVRILFYLGCFATSAVVEA